jgi:hypothetical protein
MKKNPLKNHPEDKMHEELDYESINVIYDKLKTNSEEKEKTLLVLRSLLVEKLKAAESNAVKTSTENFFKYHNSEEFASLRKSATVEGKK